MATPANWDQFNEDMRQWQEQAQDLARTYRGLVEVAESGELGALAFIADLSSAPIGDLAALQESLQVRIVAGRPFIGHSTGPIMFDGARGLGGVNQVTDVDEMSQMEYKNEFLSWYNIAPIGAPDWLNERVAGVRMSSPSGAYQFNGFLLVDEGGQLAVGRSRVGISSITFYRVLSTLNTTEDSNGFIKSASPIFRLANTADSAMSGGLNFTASGAGAANGEAQGATATRDDVGVYTVHGSLGFASEGWTVEIPLDINGNRMVFVKTEQLDDGTITVRTFKPKPDLETLTFIAGEPVDIPEGRWIDLRLSMPEPEKTEPTDAA